MLCNGGRCACQASGRSCQETNECCSGLTCQSNVCRAPPADGGTGTDVPRIDATIDLPATDGPRPDGATGDGSGGDGGMCVAGGAVCMTGQRCCGDYSCAMQPGGTQTCCHNAGGSCNAQLDCCGWQLCNTTSHRCECRPAESSCITDTDCCNGAACNRPMGTPMSTMGTCACRARNQTCTAGAGGDGGVGDGGTGSGGCCSGLECRGGRCLTPGCTAPGESCGTGDGGSCCEGYNCRPESAGLGDRCCRYPALTTTEPQVSCMNSTECCGAALCTGGNCVCRRDGESCLSDVECCGRMLCNRAMGAAMGTCRCQGRGQLCLTGGQDCCAGMSCTGGTCQ